MDPLGTISLHPMALFGLPHIRLIRLLFSAETVFFSHNNSAGTEFFSQFQPSFNHPSTSVFIPNNVRLTNAQSHSAQNPSKIQVCVASASTSCMPSFLAQVRTGLPSLLNSPLGKTEIKKLSPLGLKK